MPCLVILKWSGSCLPLTTNGKKYLVLMENLSPPLLQCKVDIHINQEPLPIAKTTGFASATHASIPPDTLNVRVLFKHNQFMKKSSSEPTMPHGPGFIPTRSARPVDLAPYRRVYASRVSEAYSRTLYEHATGCLLVPRHVLSTRGEGT